jgi:ParB-like chromosome segregation protein Spo0J
MAKQAKAAAKVPKAKAVSPSRVSMKIVEFTPATLGDALASSGATKTGKMYMVDLDGITIAPGFNLRVTDTPDYREGIRELADSMKAEGYYDSQPIGVFPAEVGDETRLVLISGHRRYEAAKLAASEGADITRLPVVLKKPGSSDMDLAVSLWKENIGVRPTILERAVLANRMMKTGMDDDDIAARLGVTNKHVRDMKTIINAPKGVRDLIRDNKLAAYEAIAQLRKDPTGNKIMEAAAKIEAKAAENELKKAEKLTRKTLEANGEKPRNLMATSRMNFAVKAGFEFLLEDVEPFMGLIDHDDSWFKATRSTKKKIALSDIEFDVKIKRTKTTEELAAEDALAAQVAIDKAAAKAAKTNGNKATAVKHDDLGPDDEEDDDDLSENENEDESENAEEANAPDLRALGIAEPATGEL